MPHQRARELRLSLRDSSRGIAMICYFLVSWQMKPAVPPPEAPKTLSTGNKNRESGRAPTATYSKQRI